ncbi:MAG: VOC family protein [Candidatus Aenigmarchaeota archaeon]|nr:VOC family protein [Candidatus Aenigmarchaeota archaeon]
MTVSIDHFKITVTNFNRSKLFYSKLFKFFKLKKVFEAGKNSAWHGRIVMFGTKDWTFELQEGTKKVRFDRQRTGLDHIAFTASSRKDVDRLYEFLVKNNYEAFTPMEYPEYCKGYYACFFPDPDGIILEYVYCPVPNAK